MDYFKVELFFPTALSATRWRADLLINELSLIGFEAFEETDVSVNAYIPKELYDEGALAKVVDAFSAGDTHIYYKLSLLKAQDWNAAWESSGFDPIIISEQMLIYDAQRPAPSTAHSIKIAIQPHMSFGTGTHATTQLILSFLSALTLSGARVLDCGCGTGILSIAASKLGAQSVVAYDIDEGCVVNTQYNSALNAAANISVYQGDAALLKSMSEKFNIVLANINRNILLSDLPYYKGVLCDKGTIILSGFFTSDIPLFYERAKELGLTVVEERSKDEWAMLALR